MFAMIPLRVLGLGISFLLGVLGYFPVPGLAVGAPPDVNALEETYSAEDARNLGQKFQSVHRGIIEDLLSFQKDPDLARAEARRDEVTAYAKSAVGDFTALSNRLSDRYIEVAMLAVGLQAADRPGDNGGAIDLTWTPSVREGINEQRLYRATISGGPYQLVAALAGNTTDAFVDTGLTNGVTYYYVLRTFDGSAESPDSNEASAAPVDNLS